MANFPDVVEFAEARPSIPIPESFHQDGNALALIASVKGGLKKGGWSKEDIETWQTIALSGDYGQVLRSCFAVFDN